jgi:hypothetical protein
LKSIPQLSFTRTDDESHRAEAEPARAGSSSRLLHLARDITLNSS